MKRFFWAALAAALLFSACATVEEAPAPPEPEKKGPADPVITLVSAEPGEINFTDIRMDFDYLLENPNPVDLVLAGFDPKLQVKALCLAEQSEETQILVPAGGSAHVTFSRTLKYDALLDNENITDDDRNAAYSSIVNFRFSGTEAAGGLKASEPFAIEHSAEGSLPLVRLPRYDFDYLYIASLGLMGADIIIVMNAENPNPFDVSLNEFHGPLVVNKLRWTELRTEQPVVLPAGETVEMGFQFRLEFLSMGRTVRDLLSRSADLPYQFEGTMVLEALADEPDEEELPVIFRGEVGIVHPDTTGGQHSSIKIEDSIESNLINLFGRYGRR